MHASTPPSAEPGARPVTRQGRGRRWARRLVAALVTLVALAAVAVGIGLFLAERTMTRRIDVAVSPVALRDDAQAIKRGRYLYMSRGCADCHGADGAGRVFIDDPNGLRIEGPGLTSAPGSAVANYQPAAGTQRAPQPVQSRTASASPPHVTDTQPALAPSQAVMPQQLSLP